MRPKRDCTRYRDTTLHRTTAYIQAYLEHPLLLVELAAVAQMSPAYFARLFKGATGQTPHQYVLRCRLERAKHLLTETTLCPSTRSAPGSATPTTVTSLRCFGSPSPPLPRPTATPHPGRECGGVPPAVPWEGHASRGGSLRAHAAVYVCIGVSAISTARFSHDSNMYRTNATEGVGRLCYSSPGACRPRDRAWRGGKRGVA